MGEGRGSVSPELGFPDLLPIWHRCTPLKVGYGAHLKVNKSTVATVILPRVEDRSKPTLMEFMGRNLQN